MIERYEPKRYLKLFNQMVDKEPITRGDDVLVITDLWHDDEKTYIEYKRMYPVWAMKYLTQLNERFNTKS